MIPNCIVNDILRHETGDKHTRARMKYLREKDQEIGKEVKVTTCRPARTTIWTVVGDIKEEDVPPTVDRYDDIGIINFDFNARDVLLRPSLNIFLVGGKSSSFISPTTVHVIVRAGLHMVTFTSFPISSSFSHKYSILALVCSSPVSCRKIP